MTSKNGKALGLSTETWLRLLVPLLAAAFVGVLAWFVSTEARATSFATKDFVRAELKEHVAGGPHKGAAILPDLQEQQNINADNRAEIRALKTGQEAIQKGIEDIQRDLRMMRSERRPR